MNLLQWIVLPFVLASGQAGNECSSECNGYCKKLLGNECLLINKMLATSTCTGEQSSCRKRCLTKCMCLSTCSNTCQSDRLRCKADSSRCDETLNTCLSTCSDSCAFSLHFQDEKRPINEPVVEHQDKPVPLEPSSQPLA